MTINKYVIGIALGQSNERTALAVVGTEQTGQSSDPVCSVRHLKRYDMLTSFPDIIEDTKGTAEEIIKQSKQPPSLILEATGVGAPVVDLFNKQRAALAVSTLEAVMITAGDMEAREYQNGVAYNRLPKRNMASVVQVLLQTKRLKIAPSLAEAQTLVRELSNFKVKINTAANNETFDPWREGAEDDLVFSVAVACWHALDICSRVEVEIPRSESFYSW